MTEGEVFQFQNRPIAESEGKNRDDGTHELKHAENTTAAHPKTLDFSALSEFLVLGRQLFHALISDAFTARTGSRNRTQIDKRRCAEKHNVESEFHPHSRPRWRAAPEAAAVKREASKQRGQ